MATKKTKDLVLLATADFKRAEQKKWWPTGQGKTPKNEIGYMVQDGGPGCAAVQGHPWNPTGILRSLMGSIPPEGCSV